MDHLKEIYSQVEEKHKIVSFKKRNVVQNHKFHNGPDGPFPIYATII